MEIGVRSKSPWVLSTMYDRTRCPARGIQGGSPGAAGAVHTVGGEELHPKRQQRIAAEERLILSLPGGGGFGLATERDPDRVARDVTDGLVSIERAREVYGVALTATSQHGRYTVDKEATARLRAEAVPHPTNEP
jgi:N-methylhydantoinase B